MKCVHCGKEVEYGCPHGHTNQSENVGAVCTVCLHREQQRLENDKEKLQTKKRVIEQEIYGIESCLAGIIQSLRECRELE